MAEKKHLFGSSEKSDFILNMTDKSTKKLCGMYLIIIMIVMAAMSIPYYFTMNSVTTKVVDGYEYKEYLSDTFSTLMMSLVIGLGLVGFLTFLVGKMKDEIIVSKNKTLWMPLVLMILAAVSMFVSSNLSYSFYGYMDRAEGFLTLAAYVGFFAAAMTVTDDGWRKKASDVLVSIGLFNAIVGILQAIPATGKSIPNWFAYLYTRYGTNVADNEKIVRDIIHTESFTASGFLCTPFALGAVLTITFAIAFAGFIFDESKKRRIFYAISAVIMAVCSALTDIVPSIVGIVSAAIIITVVALVIKKKPDGKSILGSAIGGIITITLVFVVMLVTGAVEFKDEMVIATDVNTRLSVQTEFIREDKSEWIYPYLWDDGSYVIENYPIMGVGPDNWISMYQLGLIVDRSYNEYIDVAAQRGLISLAVYLAFLIITAIKGFRAVGGYIKGENNWIACGLIGALLAYMIQAFFNISSLTNTPFFWIVIGLIWSYEAKGRDKIKSK